MKVYRAMMPRCETRCTDLYVLHHLQLMSPHGLLRFLRISFFVRCITRPQPLTLAAVYCARHNRRSWLRAISNDLKFI
eukprot:5674393-Karenia_brevis.AAC.1